VQGQAIKSQLRSQDCLYVLEDGEIEDLLHLPALVLLLNSYLSELPHLSSCVKPVCLEDFVSSTNRTHTLGKLWRERRLGNFDKVGFAKFIAAKAHLNPDISADGRRLIASIANQQRQNEIT
jgi:hypothetical protein